MSEALLDELLENYLGVSVANESGGEISVGPGRAGMREAFKFIGEPSRYGVVLNEEGDRLYFHLNPRMVPGARPVGTLERSNGSICWRAWPSGEETKAGALGPIVEAIHEATEAERGKS